MEYCLPQYVRRHKGIFHSCGLNFSPHHFLLIIHAAFANCRAYLFIWAVSWALCSWKRSLMRCWEAIHFWTQRLMQPLSRVEMALEVKSSTQDMKQCSTRPPKAYLEDLSVSIRSRFSFRKAVHTPINSLTWRFCMRCSRVRCSAAESLQLGTHWLALRPVLSDRVWINVHIHFCGLKVVTWVDEFEVIEAVVGGLTTLLVGYGDWNFEISRAESSAYRRDRIIVLPRIGWAVSAAAPQLFMSYKSIKWY